MIFLAYGLAVVIAILAVAMSRWIWDGGSKRIERTRIMASAIAAAHSAVVVVLVSFAEPDDVSPITVVVAATASIGGLMYIGGLLRWNGFAAWVLRLVGWGLLMSVTVVPSQLTLLLPLTASLTATLRPTWPPIVAGSVTGKKALRPARR